MEAVGRYEIKSALTGGGMADVFIAHDPSVDREVVIKIVKAEFGAEADFLARFKREARIVARLEHDAIVPVYDFGEQNGRPYLVMRKMTGGALSDRIENGPLSLSETSAIVSRVADALDYSHNCGVIHRDLKPANILFDNLGRAFLSDFGIAKVSEVGTNLTGTGIIGTPAYMSPEQARAMQDLDRRSDVYSLGVVVFQLLTGELPYTARDGFGVALAHITQPVPDVRQVRPDLPLEAAELICRALAKVPDDRYQSAGELALDLSEIAAIVLPGDGLSKSAKMDRRSAPEEAETPPSHPRQTSSQSAPILPSVSPQRLLKIRPAVCVVGMVAAGLMALVLIGALVTPGLLRAVFPAWPATTVSPLLPTETGNVISKLTQAQTVTVATLQPASVTVSPIPTFTAAPTPQLEPGASRASPTDGMTLVYVPEGTFRMGAAANDQRAQAFEKPQHTIYLDAFWIDRTDVTNAMYAACVNAGACQLPASKSSDSYQDYFENPIYAAYPVLNVQWADADAYCRWAGRRMPTEAEWEKAARGTDGRLYPWGDQGPTTELANFNNLVGDTSHVGSYPAGASPYGVLDMAGNAMNWVADWFDPNYYATSPENNPTGPISGQDRVLRGGSWYNDSSYIRSAFRGRGNPASTLNAIGFRCAMTP